jgi:hypothetical protein
MLCEEFPTAGSLSAMSILESAPWRLSIVNPVTVAI